MLMSLCWDFTVVHIKEERVYGMLLKSELAGVSKPIHWRIRFKSGGLSHWVKVSNFLASGRSLTQCRRSSPGAVPVDD